MPTGSARDKRFRRLRGRVFRTIPDQQNFVARKRCRAGRHDGALRAYPEAIGQDEPRARPSVAGAALLQAGFQPFSQLAAASHSLQAFSADQYGAGLPELQSAKRGLVRHHREMSTRARRTCQTASACIDAAASCSVAAITAAGGVCFGNDRHCLAPASLLMAEIEFPVLRMISESCASVSLRRFLTTFTCTRSRTSRLFRERFLRRIIICYLLCRRKPRQAGITPLDRDRRLSRSSRNSVSVAITAKPYRRSKDGENNVGLVAERHPESGSLRPCRKPTGLRVGDSSRPNFVPAREPGAAPDVIEATQLRRTIWVSAKVLYSGCSAFRFRSSCCSPCSGITRLDQFRESPRIFAGFLLWANHF